MEVKELQLGQKAMIVNDKGKILVIQRGSKSDGGTAYWDFPGGRIDWGESLREGLIREVAEETGLEITEVGLPQSIMSFFPKHKEGVQVVRLIYPCKASGKVTLSDEHETFKWIDPEAATKLNFMDNDYIDAINRFRLMPYSGDMLGEGMLEESLERRKSMNK